MVQARLDLRGKRYEEAMNELDAFIDQALLNNMAQVDIIHGIGTGVIREGRHQIPAKKQACQEFRLCSTKCWRQWPTIVTFKG